MEYLKQTVAKNNVWFSKNMFMSGPKFLVNFLKFAKEREKSLVCASNEANLEFLLQITGIIPSRNYGCPPVQDSESPGSEF